MVFTILVLLIVVVVLIVNVVALRHKVEAAPGPAASASPSASSSPAPAPTYPSPTDSPVDSPAASDAPSADAPSPTVTDTASASPSGLDSGPVTNAGTPVRVSLAALCNSGSSYICGDDYAGTIQVGDQVFSYVGQGNGFATVQPPYWGTLLKFPMTTCTKLMLKFATNATRGVANIRLIQSNAAPQTKTTSAGKMGSFTATLNGSPFYIQYNTTTGRPVFIDGYAVCTSDSGV